MGAILQRPLHRKRNNHYNTHMYEVIEIPIQESIGSPKKSNLYICACMSAGIKTLYRVDEFYRSIWETIMTVVTLIALTIIPVIVTFHTPFPPEMKNWPYLIIMTDTLFLCDIILWFFTGYYEYHTKVIVLDPRIVACKYIKGYFILDVLSALPLEMIGFIVQKESATYFNFFKIFRLRTIIIYGRRLRYSYRITFQVYKVTEVIVVVLLSLHWAACSEYYLPKFIATFSVTARYDETQSWIEDPKLQQYSSLQWYVLSLYRATAALVCSEQYLAVIAPEDVVLNIILITIGRFAAIYLLAQLLQLLATLRATSKKYFKLVQQLHEYMRYKELPYGIQRRLLAYCDYCFKKRFDREKDIISQVSAHLREELVLHCCGRLVESVEFFQHLPPVILTRLSTCLRSEVFLANDLIVKAGTPGDAMYFIASGTVAIYTSLGKEVCHLEDGAHFGEIALIMENEHRIASVIAVETCELYILLRVDFQSAIEAYPHLLNRLRKQALQRLERTLLLDEAYKAEGLAKPTNINISNVNKGKSSKVRE